MVLRTSANPVQFLYPIVLALTHFGFRRFARKGNDVQVTENGFRVFSERSGEIGEYTWGQIARMSTRFDPPFCYPELLLSNGERVALHLANRSYVVEACRKHRRLRKHQNLVGEFQ